MRGDMGNVQIPDLSTWLENHAERIIVTDDAKNDIGLAKIFFKYDLKHPDKRYHSLMCRCMIFYAFGVVPVAKHWIVYDEDATGKIYVFEYTALCVERKNDLWIIGLPNEVFKEKTEYDKGGIVALTLFLKTSEGDRSVRIANPYR